MRFVQTFLIVVLCFTFKAYAVDSETISEDVQTREKILDLARDEQKTDCASKIFSDALSEHIDEISDTDTEEQVRMWAREAMRDPDVLEKVLECPEIKNIDETATVAFTPITYDFKKDGKVTRTITINYTTQPKVLKQRLILSRKPSLPNGDPNPDLMDTENPGKYLNTEPAWYAIMVVQHDSLKDFVGPGKNNTVSMKWIDDNIDRVYPKGYWCTSRSAWANDRDTINQVVREVVHIDDDTNDYYVAGDMNLEWVFYAEIVADIALSVATMGGGTALTGMLKTKRAFRTGKNHIKSMYELEKVDTVKKYMTATKQISQHTDDIAKLEKEISTLTDAGKIADKRQEIRQLEETIRKAENDAEELVKANKEVKQYKEQAEAYKEVHTYFKEITALRRPQTGNVITRNIKRIWKTGRALNDGAKTMTKADRVLRAGMSSRSARIKDFLVDATLKHGSRLAKYESKLGKIYGATTAVKIAGDLYDHTSATSKEFSNGIEFKPFCLLSADDLKGQDNVVNYGMWLMWQGNSTDPADDDAAYLQAMDFAAKFFYQLDEFQDANGAECNVDIYVVHPLIRLDETNTEDPHGELFYLFMNEIPWTTAEQFGEQVKDVEDWERAQRQLDEQDPHDKYRRDNTEDSESTQEQIAADETSETTETQTENTAE